MELKSVIGIDPDSKKIECYYAQPMKEEYEKKQFYLTTNELNKFLKWKKSFGEVEVAIEGKHGQSSGIEKLLEMEGIVYYSLPASRVNDYRKSMMGENKNNLLDAEATARLAISMMLNKKLDPFKKEKEMYKNDLRILTREYNRISKMHTSEINTLWKYIKEASNDLYLMLQGCNPEIDNNSKILDQMGILTLLCAKPDINEWKSLNKEEFLEIMGKQNYKGREKLIINLQKISNNFISIPPYLSSAIQLSVERIILLKKQIRKVKEELENQCKNNKSVQKLLENKGIGIIYAAGIVGEILTIKRFATNDKLAGYSGIGLKEYKSGDNEKMKKSVKYNHRLKDMLIQGTNSYMMNNKDSQLAGYYKHLLKNGMKKMEAQKRAARGFIRKIYRQLMEVESNINN